MAQVLVSSEITGLSTLGVLARDSIQVSTMLYGSIRGSNGQYSSL